MPAYDRTSFHPPAPLAQVNVRSSLSGKSVDDVKLLIDTGADVSLLPRESVSSRVETEEVGNQYELEGFDGTKSMATAVHLELHFLGRLYRGQFLIVDQECGILGRNILNTTALLMDGPNLTWSKQR